MLFMFLAALTLQPTQSMECLDGPLVEPHMRFILHLENLTWKKNKWLSRSFRRARFVMGGPGQPVPCGALVFDYDGDCDVDLRDFAEFQNGYVWGPKVTTGSRRLKGE